MFQGMPYFSLKYCFFTAAGSALLRLLLREEKNIFEVLVPFSNSTYTVHNRLHFQAATGF